MAKQWGLERTDDINCEEGCVFGEICEERGSSYLYFSIINESADESLKEIFKKCGGKGCLHVIFLPIVHLKKSRF